MRILIADDEATSRFIIETKLRQWGYEVEVFESGRDAWDRLQSPDGPKLAVLDWIMPDFTGVEICRRIKQMPTNTPPYVILLTSLEDKARLVEALDAGANDYMTKPFHAAEFKARIQVGIRMLNLQDDLNRHVVELENALSHIKRLEGMIPICSYCHKIRNDDRQWERFERYISERTDAQFSHGICPTCREIHFPSIKTEPDASTPRASQAETP